MLPLATSPDIPAIPESDGKDCNGDVVMLGTVTHISVISHCHHTASLEHQCWKYAEACPARSAELLMFEAGSS